MAAVPGTSLDESVRLGAKVTSALQASPYVRSVSQQIGRAELSDDTWGTHYSEFHVGLKPLSGEQAESAEPEIRRILSRFPGVYFAIKPFLTERMEEVMSGVNAEVVIKIFGDDLDSLDNAARQVAQVVSGTRGAADVQMESPPGMPEVVIRLRPDRMQQFAFRPVAVLEAVQTAYQGQLVGETYEGNRVFDVSVILDESSRRDPESVGSLMLHSPEGLRLPLRELADVYLTTGRYMVVHDGAQRRQSVSSNVLGRDVASFVAEARKKVREGVRFPRGVYPVFTGAAEARSQAQREILLYSLIAGVGIILLLSMVFPQWRNLLLILVNIPFALVGGVAAVFMTGGWLTVGSMVGFVTLFGITMRNSIMMLSHFEHLVREEGATWSLETVLRGSSERLSPVLMTALVTALGLLPLALGSGDPGREVEGPMAIVILGGLVTSTVLNLLVLPTLAFRYGRFD
jgi:Cu/Ag efflux pump CusA